MLSFREIIKVQLDREIASRDEYIANGGEELETTYWDGKIAAYEYVLELLDNHAG
jgi:hypothetical protein